MFSFRFINAVLLAVAVLVVVLAGPAAAQITQPISSSSSSQYGADVQQQILNNVIQNIIENVRDELHRRLITPTPRRLPFSAEDSQFDNRDPFLTNGISDPFDALGYAKAPYTKAPPMAPPQWLYGANLVGSGDGSSATGSSIHTETITGAFDVTRIGVLTATDAITFIGTGSNSWAHQSATLPPFDSTVPSSSITVSYLNGGWSADFTSLASWTTNSSTMFLLAAPINSSTVSYTGNINYRIDYPNSVWIEPTGGATYYDIYTANFETRVADVTELHAGVRVGTEWKWMGYTVEPTIYGGVYGIVDTNVVNPLAGGIPLASEAAGLVGGKGYAKVCVIWAPNFSSYVEVHAFGTGDYHTAFMGPQPATVTVGAQGGLRYTW
jgi:hypothetical protein